VLKKQREISMPRGKPFPKGVSGNPSGRPSGSSKVAKLREQIAAQVPEIVSKLIEAARGGDVSAARLLLERAVPAVKPIEQTAPIHLPTGTLTDRGEAILAAIAAGDLSPSQGAQLLASLGSLAKAIEIDEIERRIKALEARASNGEAK
jgi:hypothetical protein